MDGGSIYARSKQQINYTITFIIEREELFHGIYYTQYRLIVHFSKDLSLGPKVLKTFKPLFYIQRLASFLPMIISMYS